MNHYNKHIFANKTAYHCSIKIHASGFDELLESIFCLLLVVCVCVSCSTMSYSLLPHARFLWLWDFSGKNIGVGCHSLLQGIFLTQGLNSSLLLFRHILYCLNHQGSPLLLVMEAFSLQKVVSW